MKFCKNNSSLIFRLKKDLQISRLEIYKPSLVTLFFGFGLILISFFWFFEDFLFRQFQFAVQQQADWGHTLLVPVIGAYFIWNRRTEIFCISFQPSVIGALIIIFGMLVYGISSFSSAFRHHNIMGLGVGLSLFGLLLTVFGLRSFRWIWFPSGYVIFYGQTISERVMELITYPLQDFAAQASWVVLSLIVSDVSIAGNTLTIVNDGTSIPLNVAEACSGMRMVVAFLALGTAIAALSMLKFWQKMVLISAAIPVALGVNVLRITSLGLFSLINPNFASGETHGFIGMLWLIPGLAFFLFIRWIIVQFDEEKEIQEQDSRVVFSCQGSFLLRCLAITIVFMAGGAMVRVAAVEMNAFLQKEPVPLRWQLTTLPTRLGDWKMFGEDAAFDASMIEEVGTSKIITRTYERGSTKLLLHVAYYTGQIDAVPHVPDRCMVAGGYEALSPEPENVPLSIGDDWNLGEGYQQGYPVAFSKDGELVSMPIGDKVIRMMEFRDPVNPGIRRHSGYFFVANGSWTPTPDGVRMLAFDLQSRRSYYCKVQFDGAGPQTYTQEQYLKDVELFSEVLMPDLMRCLPDWPLVLKE